MLFFYACVYCSRRIFENLINLNRSSNNVVNAKTIDGISEETKEEPSSNENYTMDGIENPQKLNIMKLSSPKKIINKPPGNSIEKNSNYKSKKAKNINPKSIKEIENLCKIDIETIILNVDNYIINEILKQHTNVLKSGQNTVYNSSSKEIQDMKVTINLNQKNKKPFPIKDHSKNLTSVEFDNLCIKHSLKRYKKQSKLRVLLFNKILKELSLLDLDTNCVPKILYLMIDEFIEYSTSHIFQKMVELGVDMSVFSEITQIYKEMLKLSDEWNNKKLHDNRLIIQILIERCEKYINSKNQNKVIEMLSTKIDNDALISESDNYDNSLKQEIKFAKETNDGLTNGNEIKTTDSCFDTNKISNSVKFEEKHVEIAQKSVNECQQILNKTNYTIPVVNRIRKEKTEHLKKATMIAQNEKDKSNINSNLLKNANNHYPININGIDSISQHEEVISLNDEKNVVEQNINKIKKQDLKETTSYVMHEKTNMIQNKEDIIDETTALDDKVNKNMKNVLELKNKDQNISLSENSKVNLRDKIYDVSRLPIIQINETNDTQNADKMNEVMPNEIKDEFTSKNQMNDKINNEKTENQTLNLVSEVQNLSENIKKDHNYTEESFIAQNENEKLTLETNPHDDGTTKYNLGSAEKTEIIYDKIKDDKITKMKQNKEENILSESEKIAQNHIIEEINSTKISKKNSEAMVSVDVEDRTLLQSDDVIIPAEPKVEVITPIENLKNTISFEKNKTEKFNHDDLCETTQNETENSISSSGDINDKIIIEEKPIETSDKKQETHSYNGGAQIQDDKEIKTTESITGIEDTNSNLQTYIISPIQDLTNSNYVEETNAGVENDLVDKIQSPGNTRDYSAIADKVIANENVTTAHSLPINIVEEIEEQSSDDNPNQKNNDEQNLALETIENKLQMINPVILNEENNILTQDEIEKQILPSEDIKENCIVEEKPILTKDERKETDINSDIAQTENKEIIELNTDIKDTNSDLQPFLTSSIQTPTELNYDEGMIYCEQRELEHQIKPSDEAKDDVFGEVCANETIKNVDSSPVVFGINNKDDSDSEMIPNAQIEIAKKDSMTETTSKTYNETESPQIKREELNYYKDDEEKDLSLQDDIDNLTINPEIFNEGLVFKDVKPIEFAEHINELSNESNNDKMESSINELKPESEIFDNDVKITPIVITEGINEVLEGPFLSESQDKQTLEAKDDKDNAKINNIAEEEQINPSTRRHDSVEVNESSIVKTTNPIHDETNDLVRKRIKEDEAQKTDQTKDESFVLLEKVDINKKENTKLESENDQIFDADKEEKNLSTNNETNFHISNNEEVLYNIPTTSSNQEHFSNSLESQYGISSHIVNSATGEFSSEELSADSNETSSSITSGKNPVFYSNDETDTESFEYFGTENPNNQNTDQNDISIIHIHHKLPNDDISIQNYDIKIKKEHIDEEQRLRNISKTLLLDLNVYIEGIVKFFEEIKVEVYDFDHLYLQEFTNLLSFDPADSIEKIQKLHIIITSILNFYKITNCKITSLDYIKSLQGYADQLFKEHCYLNSSFELPQDKNITKKIVSE